MVYNKDDQDVGMTHKVKLAKNQPQFSKTTMVYSIDKVKLSLNKFSDRAKMLLKSCSGIFKNFHLMEFSTDWQAN